MKEYAVFGGGCFWCTEAVFSMLRGVLLVTSGYAGGPLGAPRPTYTEVSKGTTGFAEVIRVEYDSSQISFRDLLTVFFASHDPTTLNQQGADVGPQYRSIILASTPQQLAEAESYVAQLNGGATAGAPIVTEVQMLGSFYEAEEYHKQYYERNRTAGYCQVVINPKLEKVQKEFAALLKANTPAHE